MTIQNELIQKYHLRKSALFSNESGSFKFKIISVGSDYYGEHKLFTIAKILHSGLVNYEVITLKKLISFIQFHEFKRQIYRQNHLVTMQKRRLKRKKKH